MPTPQPPSTGPTSAPGSSRTSSRKTSLKCASPEIWRSGRIVTPSASIGTTNIVRPLCLGTSGFVRASRRPNAACCAFVVHTFWPESRQEPSSCSLRAGLHAGEVRARGRLGEELAPDLVGGEHRAEVALLLLLGPVRDQRRAEHAHADDVEDPRHAGAADLLVDDHLLERAEPGAAVVRGPRHRGQAGPRRARAARRGARRRRRRPRPWSGGAACLCSSSQARTSSRYAASSGVSFRSTPSPVERRSSGEELCQSAVRCCSASPRRARAPSCWPGSRAAARAAPRSRPRGRRSPVSVDDPRPRRGRPDRAVPRRAGRRPRRPRGHRRRRRLHRRDGGDRARGRRPRRDRARAATRTGWASRGRSQQGLEAARGEVVVALDADTRPRPGLAGALAAALEDADLVTGGARFTAAGWVHPAMLATLVYRFGPADAPGAAPGAARGQRAGDGGAPRGAARRRRLRGRRGPSHRRRRAGAGARARRLARRVPRRLGAGRRGDDAGASGRARSRWPTSRRRPGAPPTSRSSGSRRGCRCCGSSPGRAGRLDLALLALRAALLPALAGSYARRGAGVLALPARRSRRGGGAHARGGAAGADLARPDVSSRNSTPISVISSARRHDVRDRVGRELDEGEREDARAGAPLEGEDERRREAEGEADSRGPRARARARRRRRSSPPCRRGSRCRAGTRGRSSPRPRPAKPPHQPARAIPRSAATRPFAASPEEGGERAAGAELLERVPGTGVAVAGREEVDAVAPGDQQRDRDRTEHVAQDGCYDVLHRCPSPPST